MPARWTSINSVVGGVSRKEAWVLKDNIMVTTKRSSRIVDNDLIINMAGDDSEKDIMHIRYYLK